MHRAEKHLDVKFFWSLLQVIPAAQTSIGDKGEADYDIQFSKGLISDAMHSGDGALGEALRPDVHRLPAQAPRRVGIDSARARARWT